MATKVIYFTVAGNNEQTEFRADDTLEEVKDIFRAAAEAGPNDILKLSNKNGSIVNISPKLPENTPDSRYKLEVVAANSGAEAAHALGFDIGELETRIHQIEQKIMIESGDTPVILFEMKQKVENFREKLENVDHLSWLGLYKDISSGTSLQPFWNKQVHSGKKTAEHCRRVFEKFIKMSMIQVTDDVRDLLKRPTFDNWQWDDPEMLVLLRQMFIDLGIINAFSIEMSTFQQWLCEIYRHYNNVPFHNFKHCFMVTQMMYGLIWLIGLNELLDKLDLLVLLTSAICHDLDHPGYNNAYQINARTELALRYNDISPLENHHCAVAFEILEKPHCNIMKNLNGEQYKRVREGMIKCILATDMAKHNEILKNFGAMVSTFDVKKTEHKNMLMMILMKVADISNEARPLSVASPWVDCLLQEFFNQLVMMLMKVADVSNESRPTDVAEAWLECLLEEYFRQSDLEKLEGLPVAPFMDREKVTKPSSQIGFIKFVLLPLFELLGEVYPIITEDIIVPVRKALEYYTDMQMAYEEEKKRKEAENEKKGAKNGLKSPTEKEKSKRVTSGTKNRSSSKV